MATLHRLFKPVFSGLTAVASTANALGGVVVLVLVVVVNIDVVARGVFNNPFHGAVEIVQFSMVLIVFLQLPDVVRVDRLTRSDGLLNILAGSYPGLTRQMRRAIDLLAASVMALVAITTWPEFIDAWQTDHYFGTPGIFTAPWWPVRLVIVFAAVMCALIWTAKAVTGKRDLSAGDSQHGATTGGMQDAG